MNMCVVSISCLIFYFWRIPSLLRYHYYYRYVFERKHDERLGAHGVVATCGVACRCYLHRPFFSHYEYKKILFTFLSHHDERLSPDEAEFLHHLAAISFLLFLFLSFSLILIEKSRPSPTVDFPLSSLHCSQNVEYSPTNNLGNLQVARLACSL